MALVAGHEWPEILKPREESFDPLALRTTNALENLNRELRRRTKTQASLSSKESAVTLLFALIAFGQIQRRRIDGHRHVSELIASAAAAAKSEFEINSLVSFGRLRRKPTRSGTHPEALRRCSNALR